VVRTLSVHEAGEHRLCTAPGYHLVRPDGYVAAHGHGDDRVRLRAELTAHLGAPVRDSPAVLTAD
jgi:3-(3-hydroxy-phenyl)propionate hydroxylase